MAVLRQASSPWQAIWALRLAGDGQRPYEMQSFAVDKRLPENPRRRNLFGLGCRFWQGVAFHLRRRVGFVIRREDAVIYPYLCRCLMVGLRVSLLVMVTVPGLPVSQLVAAGHGHRKSGF